MKIIKIVRDTATRNRIPVYDFAPNTIRKEICNDGRATKREVSKIISIKFPELVVYRESNRIWRERYYQNMFDAVACGLTYLKLYGKESSKKNNFANLKPIVINERDKVLLVRAADYRVLTTEQVFRLHFPSFSRARKRLYQLWQHGYLRRIIRPARIGEGSSMYLYLPGKRGFD